MIKEGDNILLRKDQVMKTFEVRRGRQIVFSKVKIPLDGLLDFTYGTTFEVEKGQLVKIAKQELADNPEIEIEVTRDNRSLIDRKENQKLSSSDIRTMKTQGFSGQDIVDTLIENSNTFNRKTEFSQQKYIKKKSKRHLAVFTILKPSIRYLAELYYSKGPAKICNLRYDSMAQILTRANLRSGSRVLLAETTGGLLLAAVLERLAGAGVIMQLYSGQVPVRTAVEVLHFPPEYTDILHAFSLEQVASLNHDISSDLEKLSSNSAPAVTEMPFTSQTLEKDTLDVVKTDRENMILENDEMKISKLSHKRKLEEVEERMERRKRYQAKTEAAQKLIQEGGFDCLILATKFHPTSIALSLIDFVSPSRPVVIFSPYKEPLIDCCTQLRDTKKVVGWNLTETWLREYQVLNERTHPVINMSGGGGYILYGTTVDKQ